MSEADLKIVLGGASSRTKITQWWQHVLMTVAYPRQPHTYVGSRHEARADGADVCPRPGGVWRFVPRSRLPNARMGFMNILIAFLTLARAVYLRLTLSTRSAPLVGIEGLRR